MNPWGN